jgi:hypothetical protein
MHLSIYDLELWRTAHGSRMNLYSLLQWQQ